MTKLLFLSTYHPPYVRPLRKWAGILKEEGFWVAERYRDTTYKEDVLEEIGSGWDILLYFGHGIPGAWCGYGRIEHADFCRVLPRGEIKTVLSLSCHSLSRRRGPSVGDAFIRHLRARQFAGYRGQIAYEDNLACLEAMMLQLLQRHSLVPVQRLSVPLQWMKRKIG